MPSADLIERLLHPCLVLFPLEGHNGASLRLLAGYWRDLLADEDVGDEEFAFALRRAMKRCRYWPKIADILEGVREFRENPPRIGPERRLAQESVVPLSAEERRRNLRRMAIIGRQARREITAEEAERMIREAA